jgi:sugar lactone lactonase YvrE
MKPWLFFRKSNATGQRSTGPRRQRCHPVGSGLESLEGRELLTSFLGGLQPYAQQVVSTIPSNGDVDPTGVAVVPAGFPTSAKLAAGDILVSNFNNHDNLYGTGTTIMAVTPGGQTSTFFQSQSVRGLDGGLAVLKGGYVLVANVPTADGTAATIQPGSLLVLNSSGNVVLDLTSSTYLDGPWGLTVDDRGNEAFVFVSNILNGTVSRLDLSVSATGVTLKTEVQIAFGFAHRADPAVLVVGPSGLAFSAATDTLYVASSDSNEIYAIPHAELVKSGTGTGSVVVNDATHLHGPTGLAIAPDGDLIVANNDGSNVDPNQPSEIVEYTPAGQFVTERSIDPNNGGAFGFAIGTNTAGATYLAAVDVNTDQLEVTFPFDQTILNNLPRTPQQTVSTIPSNGDVDPLGVAVVPAGFPTGGTLSAGDVLVSNFNDNLNLQGTGSTIVAVTPSGQATRFFQGQPALGLDGGLAVLKGGYVLVANVPTFDGTPATVQQGSLLILNARGQLVGTLTSSQYLDGPWGMTVDDHGTTADVFVSNVLNGTITRIVLSVSATGVAVDSMTQIASGYSHRLDPAALVLGPAGLAFDATTDTLYVASSAVNAVYAVPNAETATGSSGTGTIIYSDPMKLHGPAGLVLAPNGDLIIANSDTSNADPNQPSELVEITTTGQFVAQLSIDPNLGGAFGLTLTVGSDGTVTLIAADDNSDQLKFYSE